MKKFFITTKMGNYMKVNEIYIKCHNDKILLYLDEKIIHIFYLQNISYIDKCIQISSNNKLISIPDEQYLCFYKFDDIIAEIFTPYKKIKLDQIFINGHNLYKCLIYFDKFISISKNQYEYNISSFDFILNKFSAKSIKDIDHFTFSENGNYLLTYNSSKIVIIDMNNNEVDKIKMISDKIWINTLMISNDGCTIVYLTNNKLIVICDDIKTEHNMAIDQIINKPAKLITTMINYDMIYKYGINKIYSINFWDTSTHNVNTILLNISNSSQTLIELGHNNVQINNTLEFVTYNNHQYIYKFTNIYEIYDIDSVMQNVITNILLSKFRSQLSSNKCLLNVSYLDVTKSININFNIAKINLKHNFNASHFDILKLVLDIIDDHKKINEYVIKISKNLSRNKINIIISLIYDIAFMIINNNINFMDYIVLILLKITFIINNLEKQDGIYILHNNSNKLYEDHNDNINDFMKMLQENNLMTELCNHMIKMIYDK